MSGGFLQAHCCWKLKVYIILQVSFYFVFGRLISGTAHREPPRTLWQWGLWDVRAEDDVLRTRKAGCTHEGVASSPLAPFTLPPSWEENQSAATGNRWNPKGRNRDRAQRSRKKKIYKTQNQVEKRHTQSSGWNMWLKRKEKEKRHQAQPHQRTVFLVTTLFNSWKMNFKSTGFGNGRGFSPSQALKAQFLFILTAAELGLIPEGRQPFLPAVASFCSLL